MPKNPLDENQIFQGYQTLESNYVYTPNHFFDVVLPHSDRGCARIVGFLIRQQLGYLNEKGEPIDPVIGFSQRDLVEQANVSSGAIAKSLRKAVELNFIEEVRKGRSHSKGKKGETALYSLKWDEECEKYSTSLENFRGFFAQDGNRTPIPNQFFDHTLRNETFSVTRAVGMIIRHSIGFTTKYGSRVEQVALPISRIATLANMGRTITSQAVASAEDSGHISCVKRGEFGGPPSLSKSSVYRVNWITQENNVSKSDTWDSRRIHVSENETSQKVTHGNVSKSGPERSQKVTHGNVSKSGTDKITIKNNTSKQQQSPAVAVDEIFLQKVSLLKDAGFLEQDAHQIAQHATVPVIKNQIDWLEQRNPTLNRLGMLRKSILEDWESPIEATSPDEGEIFFRNFVVGYHDQEKDWIQPSHFEREIAAEFHKGLVNEFGGDVETWGKAFGAWTKQKLNGSFRSFSQTVKHRGEEFFELQKEKQRKQRRKKAREQALKKEEEQKQMETAWLEYLRATLPHFKESSDDAWNRFEALRAETRSRHEQDKITGRLMVKIHDSEETLLRDFQQYFQDSVMSLEDFISDKSKGGL